MYYCFLRVMRDSLEQRVLSQFKRVPLQARSARLAWGGGTAAQCAASRRLTGRSERLGSDPTGHPNQKTKKAGNEGCGETHVEGYVLFRI